MSTNARILAGIPLSPAYPFKAPGEEVLLYSGPLGRSVDDRVIAGSVRMRYSPQLEVAWQLDEPTADPWDFHGLDTVNLYIPYAGGNHVVAGNCRSVTHGWLSGTAIGSNTTPLTHVIAHWLNLPAIPSSTSRRDGKRWQASIGDWLVTLDEQPTYEEIWRVIREDHAIAMTHVMHICRADGEEFEASDAKRLLTALQYAVSFGLGRWVAPTLPVGFDVSHHRVWGEWGPSLCDPGGKAGLAWWYHERGGDLEDLLTAVYRAFIDPTCAEVIDKLLPMAVQSNQAGFVEQRIMTAFSGLELLSWMILKLGRGLSRSEYDNLRAGGRLRQLLLAASMPTTIDSAAQPALAQYAADESNTSEPLDGPDVVARVRNRIVHPKAPRDEVYRLKGLTTEAWLLTRHYLNQLILYWIGYVGSYQVVLGPGGWAGDVARVPWAVRGGSLTSLIAQLSRESGRRG